MSASSISFMRIIDMVIKAVTGGIPFECVRQRHSMLSRPARIAVACVLAAMAWAPVHAQVVTNCPAALETTQLFPYGGAPATFTVPANVNSVRIIAVGADGGERVDATFASGAGAQIEGTFAVTSGQVITAIAGRAPPGANDFEAGGGGASGAYIGATLAVIAGGGGGDDNTGNGGGGLTTNNGADGGNPAGSNCNAGGLGGVGGAGGQFGELPLAPQTNACQTGNGGAGGGGLNTAGGSSFVLGTPPARRGPTGGGACSIAGAAGGQGGSGDPLGDGIGAAGGFGLCGGGGADHRESGGGGGYSGGGGGPEGVFPGGGGSFVAATATTTTLTAGATGGGSGRNGSVRLCYTTRADLQITKTNTPGVNGDVDQAVDTVTSGVTTAYTIVVSNTGPTSANGTVVRDPVPTGLTCSAVTCGGPTGGAVCPAVSLAALQSPAGVTIATLPANSSLTFTLTCTPQ
jgi:uncharacterized repeat protein (TIGR01451 family)